MLMPASKEFIHLCQAQMMLVGEALRADSTAIYLADNWHEDTSLPDLVPIAAYPNPVVPAQADLAAAWILPSRDPLRLLPGAALSTNASSTALQVFVSPDHRNPVDSGDDEQLIIPLMHEGVVIGVLTSQRIGQPWQERERHQWDRLAQTLTLACVLDQRGQWLENRLQHNRDTHKQQSQRFHELLHQIRSPLTAIKTFGKLLMKRLDPEGENTSLVRGLVREGDRIQDLLQYFDLTLQATDHHLDSVPASLSLLPPDPEISQSSLVSPDQVNEELQSLTHFGGSLQNIACNLPEVLMPVLESAQVLAESRQVALNVEVIQKVVIVRADPKAITEIISALLENAFKYAGNHALIWVKIGLQETCGDKHFHGILVGDTGPGIPLVDQPHIFDRHYRGIQQDGKVSGTGLGLSIVQDLVHTMGGYIELFSPLKTSPWQVSSTALPKDLGQGTIFVIWLPTAHSH